jgi:hypothetical protein
MGDPQETSEGEVRLMFDTRSQDSSADNRRARPWAGLVRRDLLADCQRLRIWVLAIGRAPMMVPLLADASQRAGQAARR